MHFTRTARVAALAVLATVLFAGCAAAEPDTATSPKPSATVEETPAELSPEEALAEAASIGGLGISVIEVIDPRTFVVGPNAYEQEHRGLSGEITADIRAGSDLVTPAETECGYDEALAFATEYFAANPDDAYMLEGDFVSDGYFENLLRGGFGYIPNNQGTFAIAQSQAEHNKSGLWTTCPGFGA